MPCGMRKRNLLYRAVTAQWGRDTKSDESEIEASVELVRSSIQLASQVARRLREFKRYHFKVEETSHCILTKLNLGFDRSKLETIYTSRAKYNYNKQVTSPMT